MDIVQITIEVIRKLINRIVVITYRLSLMFLYTGFMWKWFKRVLLVIGIIIILSILYLFQPWVLLPHKHIQMSLPFDITEDSNISLIPMGEKIEHNESNGTPDGHPGLDFGFK